VDETAPERLFGDEMRVKQILNNLLSNAFKYTGEGRVAFDVAWRRREETAVLTFTVSDSGIGIKKEDIGKLFKEYSQLNSRANRQIEGTGLGLSITKRLVELMGGLITAESEYGVGSVFKVELPQKISNDAPIGKDIADSLKQLHFMENRLARGQNMVRSYMPYGRALIVDDVATNRDVAKGLMLPYGLSMDCVTSGREAIEKIRSICDGSNGGEKYDIVFMDHMMPEMDGIEATQIIRNDIGAEYARTVPIIALTANAITGSEEMFIANGFNGFIPKPIDIMQLDAVLNKWVRDRQSDETLIRAAKEHAVNLQGDRAEPDSGALSGVSVDGLDITEGTRRYGDEAAYLQILGSYAIHTPGLLESLEEFKGSMPDYAIAVHGLKGASYGICANEVGRMAEALESAAKSGDFEMVGENHETLVNTVNALLSSLNDILQTASLHAGGAKREYKDAPDRELLQKMLSAATRSKTSEMDAALSELERYEYDSGGDIVAWLREQMDNLEYRAIRHRLEELIS
jgi:CheY-like chemotaxis protein/anti-sigma regulatory factor (Ser/Thr protein kinase)